MKRIINLAAASIIMLLCTVVFGTLVTSCNSYDTDLEDIVKPNPTPGDAELLLCHVIKNTGSATGVIKSRAIAVPTVNPDGVLKVVSTHEMQFSYDNETITRTYEGTNDIKAYGVSKPRYAANADIFDKCSMTEDELEDGRVAQVVSFGNVFKFTLVETQTYDTDTVKIAGKVFDKCKNGFVKRELLGKDLISLERDSADWKAYQLTLHFRWTLEQAGEKDDNVQNFDVIIGKLWLPKPGSNPEIPGDELETVAFEDKDFGFDYVDDETSNTYFTLVRVLSDGSRRDAGKIELKLENTLSAPEYQTKIVKDFDWTAGTASAASPYKMTDYYEKEDDKFVIKYGQKYTTRTNKSDCIFTATYEGSAYYVDSLAKRHYFLEEKWSFSDKGTTDKELEATEGFERLLLTSNIIGTFNKHDHAALGEVELKKAKEGGNVDIVKYEYPEDEFGIKETEKGKVWYTYCTRYAVYSDGTREKLDEIGTNLYLTVDVPEYQVVTVYDFNIADVQASIMNPTLEKERTDGSFAIKQFRQSITTNTNKSSCTFIGHFDKDVVYTDEFGKEVVFKGLSVSFKDKQPSALTDMSKQDNMERKLLTSTIEANCLGSVSEYQGQVEFRKEEEREALKDWRIEQDLTYSGNNLWNSQTVIIYTYQLAGEKRETVNQALEYSLTGETKKQVMLEAATADYSKLTRGSKSTSTAQNGYISVVTATEKIVENYTTLSDNYTLTTQTASYRKTLDDGTVISFSFLAPENVSVNHGNGSLTATGTTQAVNGVTYDVYKHVGSLNLTVNNQNSSTSVEKDVLVKKNDTPDEPEQPFNPAFGKVVRLAGATLVYNPNEGEHGKFHKNLVIDFEKGKLVVTDYSFNANTNTFTASNDNFFEYGTETWDNTKIRSAVLVDGQYRPATLTMNGTGWVYVYEDMNGKITTVNMSENLALTCGIKSFAEDNSAKTTPELNWSYEIRNNVLYVKNTKGVTVFTIK